MGHNTQPVNIRIDKDMIERLKRMARNKSVKRDENISYAELVREAIVQMLEHNEGKE